MGDRLMSDYISWANYETWNINLWVMNDEPLYRAWQNLQQHYGVFTVKTARVTARTLFGKKTPDGVRISSKHINWKEIVNTWNEEKSRLLKLSLQ
jgi:hypothetical protein